MRLLEQIPKVVPFMPKTTPVPSGVATFAAAPVKQLPLQTFGADNLISASQDVTIDVTLQFGDRCVGMLLVSTTGTVQVSINNGGFRTVTTDQAINDASIQQVRIKTGVASSVIVQFDGV